jgi:5-methylcytosine-specific restriction endonuclease McrBC GTP-binding regulatory subunit McrB
MTRIIMSQTEMTEEEIKVALEKTNYDLKRVIREYMKGGIDSKNTNASTNASTSMSANQMRFSEIRSFMDKSAEQYYRRQEMTKIYNQVLERKKAEASAGTAASARTADSGITTDSTTSMNETSKL